jgi:hypothetical protein
LRAASRLRPAGDHLKPADADHPLRFECRIDADVTDGAGSLSAATTGTNPSASAAGSANAPPRASRRQA